MEPPEKTPGPAPGPGLPGPGGGLPGLPMFGQNFSSHFLTGLQTFASQELVSKLQKINSTASFPDFNEMEKQEEEQEPASVIMDPQEEKIYTDELKQMCEYTCQICGKTMNAYYLRKHVRDHNMSMTTYKELYGKVQFSKLSFHRCRICQNVIKANYITIMKHLKCVHNVTFKDYKKKFQIFIGKESKQMFKMDPEEDTGQEVTERAYSDKASEMCKVFCKVCNIEFPTHQFRFHVKSKHKINFNEYRDLHGTLEIHNRVYHRCKVCFKVLLFQYEKLASHVTDSHGIKMSAYVRLYLERTAKVPKAPKAPKGTRKKREKKEKVNKVKPTKTKAKLKAYPTTTAETAAEGGEPPPPEEKPPPRPKSKFRMRTRGAVKEEEGLTVEKFVIKRELEEILMNAEIGEIEDSEEEKSRRSRRKKPRKKITRFRRKPKTEQMDIADIKTEIIATENDEENNVKDEEVTVKIGDEVTGEECEEGAGPSAKGEKGDEGGAVDTGPSVSRVKLEPASQASPQENGETADNQVSDEQAKTEKEEDKVVSEDTSPEKQQESEEMQEKEDIKEKKEQKEKQEKKEEIVKVVKSEMALSEMVFSDDPEEMCLCQCSFCDKIVPYDLLRKHVTSKHGKVKDDYGEYKYIRLTYHRCKKCNLEILFSYNNIKLHLNRFHKLSINEYQQSMGGFSGKIVSLRALKAMYEEEDGLKESSKRARPMQSSVNERMLSSYMDHSDRSYPTLLSPEKRLRREEERGWFDGNTFSCRDNCSFTTFSLDRFEDHVRLDHHTTIDAFKGRFHSTGVSLQCEYCGDSVYHELRSLQHHLDSHYLTLDQYQSHYLRHKGDISQHLEAAVQPKLDLNPSFNPSSRLQQMPLPETASLSQAFSETSALLDHLKRSELFRSSNDKHESSVDYSNHDNYRSQESGGGSGGGVGYATSAQDHFRPFDDSSAGVAARGGGDFNSYGRSSMEQQGLDLGPRTPAVTAVGRADHDTGRNGSGLDQRDHLLDQQHRHEQLLEHHERGDGGDQHVDQLSTSASDLAERSHLPMEQHSREQLQSDHQQQQQQQELLQQQARSQLLEARSQLLEHQERMGLDQAASRLLPPPPSSASSLDHPPHQNQVLDLGRDAGFPSPRSTFASSATPSSGLPIDYSQHVQHRTTAADIGHHREAADAVAAAAASDVYKQHAPAYLSELAKHDSYQLKAEPSFRPDLSGGGSVGYPPKPELFLPKAGTASDLYPSASSPYSPKPLLEPPATVVGGGLKLSPEDQKSQQQQENYFRYVTSQIHEYYNRRQGAMVGGAGVPLEAAAAAVYGRDSTVLPRTEAFEQDFGGTAAARHDNFHPAAAGAGNMIHRGGDMFGGYRRENF